MIYAILVAAGLILGGVSGYFIGDGLAPKSDYIECLEVIKSGKGGGNIKDCESFSREKTIKGMIENFKLCYETYKITDKPESLNCQKEVIERFQNKKKKEENE